MTWKATLTDRPTDGRGIAVTTIDGVVLDVETARRDDSGRIIIESQLGDNPKAVSITDIRIYPYSHTDLQLALKEEPHIRKVKELTKQP